jgi:hypothetical protein
MNVKKFERLDMDYVFLRLESSSPQIVTDVAKSAVRPWAYLRGSRFRVDHRFPV